MAEPRAYTGGEMAEPTTRLRLKVSPGAARTELAGRHGNRGGCASAQRRNEGARTTQWFGSSPSASTSHARRSPSFPATPRRTRSSSCTASISARQSGVWRPNDHDRHRTVPARSWRTSASAFRMRSRTSSQENPGSIADETDEAPYQGNHMGDVATATFDRGMASTLEDNSTHVRSPSTPHLSASRRERSASASAAASRSTRNASRHSRGRPSASTTSGSRNGDSRPGSEAGVPARAPAPRVWRRSPSLPGRWRLAPSMGRPGRGRVAAIVADQLTKHVVASQLRLDEEVET